MGETEDYDEDVAVAAHHLTHQDGGEDEVSVTGLSGLLGDAQTPLAHKTSHQDGGADELTLTGMAGLLATAQTPAAHKTSHQDGGADEISVTGLAGLLVTAQTPAAHNTSHQDGGTDEISVAALSGLLADAQKVTVRKNTGADVGTRKRLNLIEGTNVTLTVTDDGTGDEVDIEIAAAGGTQKVIQVVNTQTGAVATGTTVIPWDDTIPQITEGDEYMTLKITPTNANNILRVDFVGQLANNYNGVHRLTLALFMNAVANALASTGITAGVQSYVVPLNSRFWMVAGTTSEITFRVRGGGSDTGTTTFNGQGAARIHGGVMMSSITITEIAA